MANSDYSSLDEIKTSMLIQLDGYVSTLRGSVDALLKIEEQLKENKTYYGGKESEEVKEKIEDIKKDIENEIELFNERFGYSIEYAEEFIPEVDFE